MAPRPKPPDNVIWAKCHSIGGASFWRFCDAKDCPAKPYQRRRGAD